MLGLRLGNCSVHNENSWGHGQAHTPCTCIDTFFPGLSLFSMKHGELREIEKKFMTPELTR